MRGENLVSHAHLLFGHRFAGHILSYGMLVVKKKSQNRHNLVIFGAGTENLDFVL